MNYGSGTIMEWFAQKQISLTVLEDLIVLPIILCLMDNSRMDFLIDSGDWFKKKVNIQYKNILMENGQKIN